MATDLNADGFAPGVYPLPADLRHLKIRNRTVIVSDRERVMEDGARWLESRKLELSNTSENDAILDDLEGAVFQVVKKQ